MTRLNFLLRSSALVLATVLAACGGGSGDGDSVLPAPPAAGTHRVALPVAVDQVHVELVDMPDLDLPEVHIKDQSFQTAVSAQYQNDMLLLQLRRSDPQTQSFPPPGGKIETSGGNPGTTVAYVLVTGRDLQEQSVTFSPLTDYITRNVMAYTERLPAARVRYFQDQLAAALIEQDLTGDGVVDYRDALAFNPDSGAHRRRLAFDYQSMANDPLGGGASLMQTYAAATGDGPGTAEARMDAITQALAAAFDPLETVPLPDPALFQVAVMEFDADYGGSVTIDEEPGLVLNAANPRLLRRVELGEGARRSFTLRAVPQADADMRFARWVGCPRENADRSCTVPATGDQRVGAQFQLDGDMLMQGIAGVVKLGQFEESAYAVNLNEAGVLSVSGVASATLAQQLAAAGPGHVIATMNWRYPLRRITAVLPGNTASSFRFSTDNIEIYDVYQAFSTLETGREPTIDDVASVQVSADLPSGTPKASVSGTPASAAAASHAWIPGYGRGVDAGNGYYLVKNPEGRGFALIAAPAGVTQVSGASALQAMGAACARDSNAPDCAALKAGSGSASLSKGFKLPGGEFVLGKGEDPTLIGSFKLAMTMDFQDSKGSLTFLWSLLGPGFDLRGNLRGNLVITKTFDLFAGFQGKVDYAKSMSAAMCGKGKEVPVGNPKGDSPQALINQMQSTEDDGDDLGRAGAALGEASEIGVSFCAGPGGNSVNGGKGSVDLIDPSKLRVSIQLNSVTPEGLLAPIKAHIGVTAKMKGKIGVTAHFEHRQVLPYDVDVDIGVPCRKRWLVTVCAPPVPLSSWKSPQRLEGKVGYYSNYRYSLGAVANAEFAPGVDLTLTMGPRSIAEELVTVGAGVSLPMGIVGKISGFQGSNFPEDVAAEPPQRCYGRFSYATSLALRLSVYAKLVPKLDVPGLKKLSESLHPMDIFSKYVDYDLVPAKLRKGTGQLFADDRQACLPLSERPARYFAESQSWGRGDLQWNQPSIIYTRNRKLVMGMDGNFVLYGLDRTDGGTGGIKAEVLLWSTNTQNYPGARVSFGDDGLLTVHDLFERLRFSSGKPARKLVLRADGALVLLDDDGNVITRLGG